MKLKLDITPDLVAMMAAEIAAGERAVTTAVREAGTGLKTAWRGQITGAGLGQRLARTIRLEQFPKGKPSLNTAAVVWSKAPVIVGAHDTGPLIRSTTGFWLAIPTPAAGKSSHGGRITPGEWERRTGLRLRFVYRRTGPSLLVAGGRLNTGGRAVASRSRTGRGSATVPIFLLVPQVKLPKRLDLARDAERAHDAVPGLIVANWVDGLSSRAPIQIRAWSERLPARKAQAEVVSCRTSKRRQSHGLSAINAIAIEKRHQIAGISFGSEVSCIASNGPIRK